MGKGIPAGCNQLITDILILGSGGAGLLAALHAHDANPNIDITVLVKGLFGKSGCTRLVQGGYNAVLNSQDSLERHFIDTLRAGKFLNDQELAWTLVVNAPTCVQDLEARFGCFFDRNPDDTIHQKAFAGQSFDRTVHKGDLTGIEIINRLSEQVRRRNIRILEEHRATDLVLNSNRQTVGGVLALDVRTGQPIVVRAKAVLMATGGGPTMYRYTAASADKAMDGLAMSFRAGALLCDMEMVQFHPTGLLVGHSLMTGTVLEEGLRGAGGRLFNGQGERYMERYDPAWLERATRDVIARSSYLEIIEGRASPNGGVFLDVSHLGARFVEDHFPGMVRRCRDVGMNLESEPVEVTPTAHFQMGGVAITPDCRTKLEGLFAAGEDVGAVHGANRLGGNGVAESTVFGRIAGDTMAAYVEERDLSELDSAVITEHLEQLDASVGNTGDASEIYATKQRMQDLMWEHVGLVRNGSDLTRAIEDLEELRQQANILRAPGAPPFNSAWQDLLDVRNQLLVSEMIARSALAREESRGSHFRQDLPHTDDRTISRVCIRDTTKGMDVYQEPVLFSRITPDEDDQTDASTFSGEHMA